MIYITGDCHGNFERFNTDIFPEQLEMNKEDYVIICGDFGGIWDKSGDSKKEAMILNQLECKSYTTLFVDGNHENFDRLSDYPIDTWNGGKVHKIRPSVIHLMRGQIFEIDDAMLSWEFRELMAEELGDGWKQLKTAPDCSFAGMEDVEKRFSVWYRDTIGQVERK